jgi:hypothetical protein
MTTEELIDIELILTEAYAYGLAYEVKQTAEKFISEGYSSVVAYSMAYEEWIK